MLQQSKLSFQPTSNSTPSTTIPTPASTQRPHQQQQQLVLVLCGVVGTGKSTLAQAIELNLPGWVRINQDELKTKSVCETRMRKALKEGKSVIIDRQNFDIPQRLTWIQLGHSFPNVQVRAFVMGTTEEECIKRLKLRRNHPTVENSTMALALLDRFCGLWVEPNLNEGFDRLIVLPALPNTDGLTVDLLNSLLQILEDSPPPSKKNNRQIRKVY